MSFSVCLTRYLWLSYGYFAGRSMHDTRINMGDERVFDFRNRKQDAAKAAKRSTGRCTCYGMLLPR